MRVGSAEVGSLVEVVESVTNRDLAWTSITGVDQRARWRLRRLGPTRTRVQLRLAYGVAGSGVFGWLAVQASRRQVEAHLRRTVAQLKRQVEHEKLRNDSGRSPQARIDDLALDGVDAEILFPNKGLTIWATPDAVFSQAMCRAYNEWAWETFGPFNEHLVPMACVATGDLDGAIAEIQRCAALGFKGLCLP